MDVYISYLFWSHIIKFFHFSSVLNRFPCTLCISEVWFLFFFNFQWKSLEQELSQGSVLVLPIAILLGVAIYNYQKVKLRLSPHHEQFSYNLKINQIMQFLNHEVLKTTSTCTHFTLALTLNWFASFIFSELCICYTIIGIAIVAILALSWSPPFQLLVHTTCIRCVTMLMNTITISMCI